MDTDNEPSLRILVAEDDTAVQDIFRVYFQKLGFEVECCGDAASAVEQFKKEPHDIAVVDFLLPKGDGMMVIKEILEVKPLPIIFVSGMMNDPDVLSTVKSMGVNWFLSKPFQFQELNQMCCEAVESLRRAQWSPT